jgi:hypothetical protein
MNTLNRRVLRNSNEFRRPEARRDQSIIWRIAVLLVGLIYFKIRIAVIQIDTNVIWDWAEALEENNKEIKQAQRIRMKV